MVTGDSFQGVKRLELGVEHALPSSAEIRMSRTVYLYSPSMFPIECYALTVTLGTDNYLQPLHSLSFNATKTLRLAGIVLSTKSVFHFVTQMSF
jgi:hypothetical protein